MDGFTMRLAVPALALLRCPSLTCARCALVPLGDLQCSRRDPNLPGSPRTHTKFVSKFCLKPCTSEW